MTKMMETNKFSSREFATDIGSRAIDVFITCASFEGRCFVIPSMMKTLSKRFVVFYNSNEVTEIVDNAHQLKSQLGENCELVALNSDAPIDNYLKIALVTKEIENNRPNILIDSTTFTHESLLVLLKLISLRKSALGKIYMAYVGASQYSSNTESDEERWLSKGVREIRSIIGYPGFTDPIAKNHLMILVGFESERTRRIIQEYEYEYVSLGFGDIKESIQSNHHRINYARHAKLMEEYPTSEKFIFCLTDPVKTKAQILSYLTKDRFVSMNTVIAPLNNKISTVGAGLAAIENQNIQLAYAKPNIYNATGYSVPSDEIYVCPLNL